MPRSKLADGRVVDDGVNTLFSPTVFQPVSTLSQEQRAQFGVVGIIEQPMPDTTYGTAIEDEKNPGAWIYTPFDTATLQAKLLAHAADQRYAKEVGGITVNGAPIATDRESQAQYTKAFVFSTINPSATYQWKVFAADGSASFVQLDAARLSAIAQAVGTHVQACFALEQAMAAAIQAGAITTFDAVDAAFA